jgi:hypothetical protein
MKAAVALIASPAALVLLLGAALSGEAEDAAAYTVDAARLPPLARDLLAEVDAERTDRCPQLPLVWLLAEVQAESGWNPRAYSAAGAAGLLQLLPATWLSAGGAVGWDAHLGPGAGHAVWQPLPHLAVAIPWMCSNLRTVTAELARSGKPTSPLDAMAVCHIAGCSRVRRSATGVPQAGEAGCGAPCARTVANYLATIHGYVELYLRSASPAATERSSARPFSGASSGCRLPDPTGTGGCVTAATAWMLNQAQSRFAGVPASCWDAHAWNPTSDHPLGRACDFTFGRIGHFPDAPDTASGWAFAVWARSNAAPLHITYVIWQGRIWSTDRDAAGWRAYTGGGVYDPSDPTGGHYDHVHVSVAM